MSLYLKEPLLLLSRMGIEPSVLDDINTSDHFSIYEASLRKFIKSFLVPEKNNLKVIYERKAMMKIKEINK